MNKRNRAHLLLTSAVVVIALLSGGLRTATATRSPAASDALALLPASDAVLYVNANLLLEDVLPRLFADHPAVFAELKKESDNIKTRSGFDPSLIDTVAVGMRFAPDAPKAPKVVVVVRGRFDAAQVLTNANAKLKPNEKLKTQIYNNRTLYLGATPGQHIAVASLDANTFVSGDPQVVRDTIDCNQSAAGCAVNDLKALAASNKDAFLGYAGNNRALAPVVQMLLGGSVDSELGKLAASVREFNGSVSAPGNTADLRLTLRTETAEQAGKLAAIFAPFRDLNIPDEPKPGLIPLVDGFARLMALFKGLDVTTQGSEAQFNLQLPFERITRFFREPPVAAPPPSPVAPRRAKN